MTEMGSRIDLYMEASKQYHAPGRAMIISMITVGFLVTQFMAAYLGGALTAVVVRTNPTAWLAASFIAVVAFAAFSIFTYGWFIRDLRAERVSMLGNRQREPYYSWQDVWEGPHEILAERADGQSQLRGYPYA